MPGSAPQTFFRPAEQGRTESTLPNALFRTLRTALRQCNAPTLFIALRQMQYLAVIERDEIIFVDGNGEYRIHNGEGGRLIKLAWQHFRPSEDAGLQAPVPYQLVSYSPDSHALQQRILGMLANELQHYLAQKHPQPPRKRTVIPLSQTIPDNTTPDAPTP